MALKTASVTLDNDDMRFIGRSGSGHAVILDNSAGDTGMRPAELIPLALAGCTAMDVISILRKKRQDVRHYEVEATGEQETDPPHAFTRIDVRHVIDGPEIDEDAVRRAIELSATKYCAVGATLSSGATEVHHSYVVHDPVAVDRSAEVIVIGPGADLTRDADLVAVG